MPKGLGSFSQPRPVKTAMPSVGAAMKPIATIAKAVVPLSTTDRVRPALRRIRDHEYESSYSSAKPPMWEPEE